LRKKLFELEGVEECTIIERENRFSVKVQTESGTERAWLSNSGRLKDLIFRGALGLCTSHSGGKTRKRLIASYGKSGRGPVVLDTKIHELSFEKAVELGLLPPFQGCRLLERGFRARRSILDYCLECPGRRTVVELKSAAAEKDGIASYPDAPSERGRKHVEELVELSKEGFEAHLVFIAPFDWARSFEIAWEVDREMGERVAEASKIGVRISSFSIGLEYSLGKAEIFLSSPSIPVHIEQQEKQI